MRRRLDGDPAKRDYGPASASVREILRAWSEIEWFTSAKPNPFRAAQRFAEHHARARLHLPQVFPAMFDARITRGGWSEFAELSARVRQRGAWNWQRDALSRLTAEHQRAKHWSPDEVAARIGPGLGLIVEDDEALTREQRALADTYLAQADVDALSAIDWQLTERNDDTSANPFLPLLDCYAAGVLPFGLGPDEFVLFGLSSR